jgi:hypothetical protein
VPLQFPQIRFGQSGTDEMAHMLGRAGVSTSEAEGFIMKE